MRNQNYITNKKIIAEVKKNQKDYVEPKPPKKDLTLTATVESITVGENATINITGLEEATGNITVTIGEKNYTGAIDKGNATITVPDLTEGNFTANITYAGDDKYNNASTTVNITVNPKPKKDLTLTATAEPITVGENAIINVTGLEEATGNITVTIGEENYTGAIDEGNATIIIPDLTEGNFTANISYAGDDKYNPASATVDITVNSGTTGGGGDPVIDEGDVDGPSGTTPTLGDLGDEDDDEEEGPTISGPTMEEEDGDL